MNVKHLFQNGGTAGDAGMGGGTAVGMGATAGDAAQLGTNWGRRNATGDIGMGAQPGTQEWGGGGGGGGTAGDVGMGGTAGDI